MAETTTPVVRWRNRWRRSSCRSSPTSDSSCTTANTAGGIVRVTVSRPPMPPTGPRPRCDRAGHPAPLPGARPRRSDSRAATPSRSPAPASNGRCAAPSTTDRAIGQLIAVRLVAPVDGTRRLQGHAGRRRRARHHVSARATSPTHRTTGSATTRSSGPAPCSCGAPPPSPARGPPGKRACGSAAEPPTRRLQEAGAS